MTDNVVKLLSPAKEPLSIDVIWLKDNSLCTTCEYSLSEWHAL
jgi:hypothetical protein